MIFQILINGGLLGSILSMMQFRKYCRLLNRQWDLDPETVKRYQARARRYLAATVGLIGTAMAAMFAGAFFT